MGKINEAALSARIDREIFLRGGSLLDFVRSAWHIVEPGSVFLENWHIEVICKELEDVTAGKQPKTIINLPPGGMKSLLTSVFWPAWAWIRQPGLRWIVASFDGRLTLRDANKLLQILQSDWYKARWGDIVILPAKPAAGDFVNSAGGFRFSTSVGGKVTGRHCDIMVIDDPIKPLDVTKATLETCIDWWQGTMATRFRDLATARRVIIMQRLAEGDLVGHLLSEGDWHHLRFPMRFEAAYKCAEDQREYEGELLWPLHMPEDAVSGLEKVMGGMVVAAQLQQRPVPLGGAVFKSTWFKYWTVLPARLDQIIFSWDAAFKGTDTSDYVVGQVWGRKGGEYYLMDQTRGRLSFSETLDAFRLLSRKYKQATGKLVEDKANGPAIVDSLKKEISGIVEVSPEGGKEARANAVSPLLEAGNVYFPDPTMPGYEWVGMHLVPELCSFPMGKNDDQVDAMTQALLYLHKRRSYLSEAMKVLTSG